MDTEHAAAEREIVAAWAAKKNRGFTVLNGGNHLKVGKWNFYPTRGTINRDGNPQEDVTGAAAFIELVEEDEKARAEARKSKIERLLKKR